MQAANPSVCQYWRIQRRTLFDQPPEQGCIAPIEFPFTCELFSNAEEEIEDRFVGELGPGIGAEDRVEEGVGQFCGGGGGAREGGWGSREGGGVGIEDELGISSCRLKRRESAEGNIQ